MKVGKDRRVPLSACTDCGHQMDAANCVSEDEHGRDHKPGPGAITICIRCGHIMAYTDSLTLRDLTNDEMVMVAGDKRIIAIQWARDSLLRDRAFCEDFVRTCIKHMKQSTPPDWQINMVVDRTLAAVPKPPRKAR